MLAISDFVAQAWRGELYFATNEHEYPRMEAKAMAAKQHEKPARPK
jgi:hypothetical protein